MNGIGDYGPAPQDVLDRVAALQAEAEARGETLVEAALHFVRDQPAAPAGETAPGSWHCAPAR